VGFKLYLKDQLVSFSALACTLLLLVIACVNVVEISEVVKVFDLTGHLKCLGSHPSQLKFDFKLDTIGTHCILLA